MTAYSFNNIPLDDGYGNSYTYEVVEVSVPGYYRRQDGYNFTNGLIPTPPPRRAVELPVEEMTEEELEELFELFDYGTPLFGMMQTGDELPVYPFIFGGVGLAAIILFIVLGKKNKKGEAAR